jgi:hypothetical protein
MLHREHSAVAVADDTGSAKPFFSSQSAAMRLSSRRFLDGLEGSALGGPAVADTEDVAPAAIERQAGEPEAGEDRRQEARRAQVEVHGVAMEQQRRPARRAFGWYQAPSSGVVGVGMLTRAVFTRAL